jgi:hypothetical protein
LIAGSAGHQIGPTIPFIIIIINLTTLTAEESPKDPYYHNTRIPVTSPVPEIDCDQTAMGLPPVLSAVFLIAKVILVKRRRLEVIS